LCGCCGHSSEKVQEQSQVTFHHLQPTIDVVNWRGDDVVKNANGETLETTTNLSTCQDDQ